MNHKKEIIERITSISGEYSAYEVFTDWIRMMAMSISNACSAPYDAVYTEREKIYLDTASRYSAEEMTDLCECLAFLAETLDDGPADVLGEIYMESGMGSKFAGQFFTPFHVSELCARLGLDIETIRQTDCPIEINEPSCGGGGMIIAAAKVLKDNDIDFQRRMRVVAQDLDWKGVYMCYVQLSLLGINAICVQGDTLRQPYDPTATPGRHILRTPGNVGLLI